MSERPTPPVEEEILSALRRISRAISLYSTHVHRHYGLTGPQLTLLREIQKSAETLTVRRLADAVSLSHATVTGILDRLEDKGLAIREALSSDKRKRLVKLTAEGARLLAEAPLPLQDRFVDELGKLESWEQTQLLSSLQRVARMMSAEGLPAAPILMTEEGDREEWERIGILRDNVKKKR